MEGMEKRTVSCQIGKSMDGSGSFKAILSDTSIDRDDEFMSQELLGKWAADLNRYLPMLADHKNSIDSLVGCWENAQVVQKGEHCALTAEPRFYKSSPIGARAKALLEEGAVLGLSVGAIPKKSSEVEKNNKTYKRWDEAELLEASLTPIPSNRNTYLSLAKSFDLDKEVIKMADEEKTEAPTEEEVVEEVAAEVTEEVKEEVKEEPKAEPVAEEAPVEEEVKEDKNINEIETLKKQNADLAKKVKALADDRKSEIKALAESNTTSMAVAPAESIWEVMAINKGINNYKEEF